MNLLSFKLVDFSSVNFKLLLFSPNFPQSIKISRFWVWTVVQVFQGFHYANILLVLYLLLLFPLINHYLFLSFQYPGNCFCLYSWLSTHPFSQDWLCCGARSVICPFSLQNYMSTNNMINWLAWMEQHSFSSLFFSPPFFPFFFLLENWKCFPLFLITIYDITHNLAYLPWGLWITHRLKGWKLVCKTSNFSSSGSSPWFKFFALFWSNLGKRRWWRNWIPILLFWIGSSLNITLFEWMWRY